MAKWVVVTGVAGGIGQDAPGVLPPTAITCC